MSIASDIGFVDFNLGGNSVVWSEDEYRLTGGFFSFLGVGVKYKLFDYPLFFAKIGVRYEDFEKGVLVSESSNNSYSYYHNNKPYSYSPFSTLNLQLNVGFNF